MKSIEALKKRLVEVDNLEVQLEKGQIMNVHFLWNEGVEKSILQNVVNELNYELPKDYIEFLYITNGAVMFKDSLYGQWGYNFLPVQDIIMETKKVREMGYLLPESSFVIAKCYGDGDMLIFDLKKASCNKAYIIDGEQGYQYNDWDEISYSFCDFVDKLIVAQGAKFWRWK